METENKKNYEISFLTHSEEGVGVLVKHLNQLGAEILNEGDIESINLAYPIKKHESAYFGCIHFEASPDLIDQLKEVLKFEDGVLRYLIITPPFMKEGAPQAKEHKIETEKKKPSSEPTSEKGLSNEDLEAKLEEISESLSSEPFDQELSEDNQQTPSAEG